MTEFAQIDVKEIETGVARSHFAESEIDQLADLILEGGGVIRPLVVKQMDIDRYQLLDGAFEYYGAVRAREKDPRQGELVNAFVVSPKTEAVIQRQIELLQPQQAAMATPAPSSVAPEVAPSTPDIPASGASEQLFAFITNFIASSEARINEMRELLFQTKRALERRIDELEKALATKQQTDLLETLNTLPDAELVNQLGFYSIDEAKARAICTARTAKEDGRFQGYIDLLSSTKGLGAQGLIGLIDRWQQMHR